MKMKVRDHVQVKESSYVIKFDFASYDQLPTVDDIVGALSEGLRDDFPNCSMNITHVTKGIKEDGNLRNNTR